MRMLSVHMMVRDGAATVERALLPLKGIADEVVLLDTGSTDGTVEKVWELCKVLGMGIRTKLVTPASDPELFIKDVPGSWKRSIPGYFTGRSILRDRGAMRNVGCDLCMGDYILKLDADDEPMSPENILPTLDYLDSRPDIEILSCPNEMIDGRGEIEYACMDDRIWRNEGAIRWTEPIHERLSPKTRRNHLLTARGLVFRHWNAPSGDGVRVDHEDYKMALAGHERILQSQVSSTSVIIHDFTPAMLYDLGREAVEVDPSFARKVLIDAALSGFGFEGSEQEWMVHLQMGRSHEFEGNMGLAIFDYMKAQKASVMLPESYLYLGFAQRKIEDPLWKESLLKAVILTKKKSVFNVPLKMLKEAEHLVYDELKILEGSVDSFIPEKSMRKVP